MNTFDLITTCPGIKNDHRSRRLALIFDTKVPRYEYLVDRETLPRLQLLPHSFICVGKI